ncbi:MAG: glutamate-cysteine ligase family protein [Gemmatimonadaceae bacterium]
MSLTEAQLLEDVRQRLFAPSKSVFPRAIGLELELIPIHRGTHGRVLAVDDKRKSTSELLSRLAEREGWREQSNDSDPPSWLLSDGARISFEPGGQIEISTSPHATASSVIASTQSLAALLREAMTVDEIDLVARGVDPYNDIDSVPLQLHRARYVGMTRYFDSIGPSGVQMMRQTAALQINLERGEKPASRWRLLNALAPIIVAMFANSREYAGRATAWASYRAHLWRTLDASRTGIVYDESRYAERYLDFALDAIAMRKGGRGYQPFRSWIQDSSITAEDWIFHLSTLFPEVRPKEFFEMRSADTIEPDALAAPVVFVTGLVYDEPSATSAAEILDAPSNDLLEYAGKFGLANPEIRRLVSQLIPVALAGARRLGEDYISARDVQTAAEYFDRVLQKRETAKSSLSTP